MIPRLEGAGAARWHVSAVSSGCSPSGARCWRSLIPDARRAFNGAGAADGREDLQIINLTANAVHDPAD